MQVQLEGRNKTRTGSSNITTLPHNHVCRVSSGGGAREREGGGECVFGATIYLITLRLAEYHRLKSIAPRCHKI